MTPETNWGWNYEEHPFDSWGVSDVVIAVEIRDRPPEERATGTGLPRPAAQAAAGVRRGSSAKRLTATEPPSLAKSLSRGGR